MAINKLNKEHGATTLIVALVLLFAISLMSFSAAKVGITEQRTAQNDIRAKEALEVAQAGIEQGIAYLTASRFEINSAVTASAGPPPVYAGWMSGTPRWITCGASEDPPSPCGARGNGWMKYQDVQPLNGGSLRQVSNTYNYTLSFLAERHPQTTPATGRPADNPSIIITSTATSSTNDPLAATARLSQLVKGFSFVINAPDAPLMAAGNIPTTGNITVWGNPTPSRVFYTAFQDAAGNPAQLGTDTDCADPTLAPALACRPLSIWSGGPTTMGGSAATCVPSGYPRCNHSQELSSNGNDGGDYVDNVPVPDLTVTSPPYFPTDIFYYTFGYPANQYLKVKNLAKVLSNCEELGEQPRGLYWVTGSCDLTGPVGNIGGTSTQATGPIILVVEGDFHARSGLHFWGMLFVKGDRELRVNGTFTLHGALISDGDITLANGSLNVVYDPDALPNRSPNFTGGFAKVPGGWIDQLQ